MTERRFRKVKGEKAGKAKVMNEEKERSVGVPRRVRAYKPRPY